MHVEEKMSYRRITKFLNRAGIKTHYGKKWSETGSSVYSVLKRMNETQAMIDRSKYKSESEIVNFRISKWLEKKKEK